LLLQKNIQKSQKMQHIRKIHKVTTKYKKIQNINHDFCRNEIENKNAKYRKHNNNYNTTNEEII